MSGQCDAVGMDTKGWDMPELWIWDNALKYVWCDGMAGMGREGKGRDGMEKKLPFPLIGWLMRELTKSDNLWNYNIASIKSFNNLIWRII